VFDAFAPLRWLRQLFGSSPRVSLEGLDPARTKLIVGLGNPGPEYAATRHNLGFLCVEELAERCGAHWQDDTGRTHSLLALGNAGDLSVVLAKPQTYMNRSGGAVKALVDQLALDFDKLLVIYDDMDLPFGALRMRERGSPGTHNGMRSVVAELNSENVPRLRIGISQAAPGTARDHVLSEFSAEEEEAVDALVERAADAAFTWATESASAAMNRYNVLKS
jgi:PTH1 family peptidyl-tRNA hydrolase